MSSFLLLSVPSFVFLIIRERFESESRIPVSTALLLLKLDLGLQAISTFGPVIPRRIEGKKEPKTNIKRERKGQTGCTVDDGCLPGMRKRKEEPCDAFTPFLVNPLLLHFLVSEFMIELSFSFSQNHIKSETTKIT